VFTHWAAGKYPKMENKSRRLVSAALKTGMSLMEQNQM
jgi:hypothetical protein